MKKTPIKKLDFNNLKIKQKNNIKKLPKVR